MLVEIVSMSQELDVQTKILQTFLRLRLPNGDVISVPATEELTLKMLNCIRGKPVEKSEDQPPQALEGPLEFGGDLPEVPEAVLGAPPSQPPVPPVGQPTQLNRPRRVQMDEAGNPVLDTSGVSPATITASGSELDEDGVASV